MRDVDVVGTGQVVVARGPQKAEALVEDFEHALSEQQAAALGLRFQDAEDELLLPEGVEIRDLELLRQLVLVEDVHALNPDDVELVVAVLGLSVLALRC